MHIRAISPDHINFAQIISTYLMDKTQSDKIPCAILEWSDTSLELRNLVGILNSRMVSIPALRKTYTNK